MSLRLDPKRLAKLTFDKMKKVGDEDEEFLSFEGPDAEDYETQTGLEDGAQVGEVEGTGEKRKRLLMKALANLK